MVEKTPKDVFYRATEFLNREAALLDERRLDEWLDLVSEDVDYHVPIRITRERGGASREFDGDGYHQRLDKDRLRARIERAEKEHAWSENPPVRLRHLVTNVRGHRTDDGDIEARSNVLVTIHEQDRTDPGLLVAERVDVLRDDGDDLRLSERTAFLESTAMGVKHLTFVI